MNILCTICMRANSQEIKNKNLTIINGKPLMYYTINAAIKSKIFDEIIVSSDSKKIQREAKKLGAKVIFTRPKNLSSNDVPKLKAIQHALIESENHFQKKFHLIFDLDVTAPLRDSNDIKKALFKFKQTRSEMLVSVSRSKKNPYFNMLEKVSGKIEISKKTARIVNSRQKSPLVYDMNAAIYIWKRNKLLRSQKIISDNLSIYEMPQEKSVDIDSRLDLKIAKMLLKSH